MTRAVQAIYRLLRPLCLYRLTGDTLVDAELAAYDAGFALVEQALDACAREAFIQTAEGRGLERREQLTGLPKRADAPTADRRGALLCRLSVTPRDCTPAGIARSVQATGLQARVEEDLANGCIHIVNEALTQAYDDLEWMQADAARMLPAHLNATFAIGGSPWNDWDALNLQWNARDALQQTWTRLDLYGVTVAGND